MPLVLYRHICRSSYCFVHLNRTEVKRLKYNGDMFLVVYGMYQFVVQALGCICVSPDRAFVGRMCWSCELRCCLPGGWLGVGYRIYAMA